jgi:hypothetical protein
MIMRDAMSVLGLATLFSATLLVNDMVIERRLGTMLSNHPAFVVDAGTHSQAGESAARMQELLAMHWTELSRTRAFAVRFTGSRFVSRLVRLGEVATPKTLNLIATDYRCGFCKADRGAVDDMLRAHPNRDYVFIEAAVLGSESVERAKSALRRALGGQEDYYALHNRAFDAEPGDDLRTSSDLDVLTEQERFLEAIGVAATPTYIREGIVRTGRMYSPLG